MKHEEQPHDEQPVVVPTEEDDEQHFEVYQMLEEMQNLVRENFE